MSATQPERQNAPGQLYGWIDRRTGLTSVWNALFTRKIPLGVGYLYTLGFATAFVFTLQAATGIFLAMYYSPSPDHAYDSIQFIMYQVPFGPVVRGLHHWGASAMVILVLLHMITVFVLGAYKYPRELTWIVGVGLLLLTMAFGFTGYLLPWDEKAYWATVVGTNIPGTLPLIGGYLTPIIRGSAQLGVLTLSRFFAVHTMLLPTALAGLLLIHLYLVVYHGVSVPPALWERTPRRLRALLGTEEAVETTNSKENYHRRYERFKRLGHAFWPNIVAEDAIVAGLALVGIVAFTIAEGVPLEARADPTNTAYVPRPEWYFMFLFQFLKYFPGNLEWVGSVVIPSLIILVILLLPLYDRSLVRSPTRRPVALALAALLIAATVYLTYVAYQ